MLVFHTNSCEEEKYYIPSDISSDQESLEEMSTKLPPKRKRWTKDEEKVIKFEFNTNFKENSIPRNAETLKVKNKFLSDRNAHQIKSKVQHMLKHKFQI